MLSKNSTTKKDNKSVQEPLFLRKERILNIAFNKLLLFSGILVVLIIIFMLIILFIASFPAIKKFGIGFFFSNSWDYRTDNYGALPFIAGTVLTSLLAILMSLPFSLSIAILLSSYLKKGFLASFIKTTTELLAGIPSIIYGFWGFYFLGPIVKNIAKSFGIIDATGYGILTSSIILAIMIIPYTASISREVLELVPNDLIEAGLSLGSTKYKVVMKIMFPYALSGIFAGVILSLGRALGETMAVTMLIGNKNQIPKNLFDTGNTIASVIANQFGEATGIQSATLIELGFILMVITVLVNFSGKYIINKFKV